MAQVPPSLFIQDSQIEAILSEALTNAVRSTPEYHLGRIEATRDANKSAYSTAFESMVGVAEALLRFAKANFPKIKLKDLRIGLDYSTRTPTVMLIVDSSFRDEVKHMRRLAREMELAVWEHHRIQGQIWILASEQLELSEIERDFPYYRQQFTNAALSTAS